MATRCAIAWSGRACQDASIIHGQHPVLLLPPDSRPIRQRRHVSRPPLPMLRPAAHGPPDPERTVFSDRCGGRPRCALGVQCRIRAVAVVRNARADDPLAAEVRTEHPRQRPAVRLARVRRTLDHPHRAGAQTIREGVDEGRPDGRIAGRAAPARCEMMDVHDEALALAPGAGRRTRWGNAPRPRGSRRRRPPRAPAPGRPRTRTALQPSPAPR